MKRPFAALVSVLVCSIGLRPPAPTNDPSMTDVLLRASVYVTEFENHLSGIVAEEHYAQDSMSDTPVAPVRGLRDANPRQHRDLTSDLLLVRPKGADRWIQFRDVFEVDGQPVRDRDQRLARLFLSPWSSISDQVEQIVNESARYNIGSLQRTINVPVLPLLFLDNANQSRFEFRRVMRARQGDGRALIPSGLPSHPAFAAPPDAWEIRYRETAKGTLIKTTGDRDLPATGRFWIEPDTGRVVMSELLLNDPVIHAALDVSYQSNSVDGFLVPREMHEEYQLVQSKLKITGAATYRNFRAFHVNVDEHITPADK